MHLLGLLVVNAHALSLLSLCFVPLVLQGRFEIISLSGSFLFSENNGQVRSGGLSVSLAGSDGRVLGGGVAGMLMAATPVQVLSLSHALSV